MRAVSDTSPFIALHSIGAARTSSTIVRYDHGSGSCRCRTEKHPAPRLGARRIRSSGRDSARHESGAGRGETEAIYLALHLRPDRLLLDDGDGRREAQRLGLRVTGVLGLLVAARRIGLLPAVRPEVDKLRTSGFRVSEGLYKELLASCGEI